MLSFFSLQFFCLFCSPRLIESKAFLTINWFSLPIDYSIDDSRDSVFASHLILYSGAHHHLADTKNRFICRIFRLFRISFGRVTAVWYELFWVRALFAHSGSNFALCLTDVLTLFRADRHISGHFSRCLCSRNSFLSLSFCFSHSPFALAMYWVRYRYINQTSVYGQTFLKNYDRNKVPTDRDRSDSLSATLFRGDTHSLTAHVSMHSMHTTGRKATREVS